MPGIMNKREKSLAWSSAAPPTSGRDKASAALRTAHARGRRRRKVKAFPGAGRLAAASLGSHRHRLSGETRAQDRLSARALCTPGSQVTDISRIFRETNFAGSEDRLAAIANSAAFKRRLRRMHSKRERAKFACQTHRLAGRRQCARHACIQCGRPRQEVLRDQMMKCR